MRSFIPEEDSLGVSHQANSDLISMFKDFSNGLPGCDIYREWAGITMVAGALERRVWAISGRLTTFPNLLTILVGPPAAGKSVINEVNRFWINTRDSAGDRALSTARNSYTKASMMDDLKLCAHTIMPPTGPPITYHCMNMAAEEFTSMFPRFDNEFLGALTTLWNGEESYSESRRTSPTKSLDIDFPIINMLLGYQPAMMASTLPPGAWEQGFMRRAVMVWNGLPDLQDIFDSPPENESLREAILQRLGELTQLFGECKYAPDAREKLRLWHLAGGPPKPTHLRLQNYTNTRTHLAQKLAIIASMSESPELIIHLRHVTRALTWLLRVESLMPEIFRAMVGDSEKEILIELHNYLIEEYSKTRPAGVHEKLIWMFLKDRLPVHKIAYVITAMEKGHLMTRDPGTEFYRPQAGASRAQ